MADTSVLRGRSQLGESRALVNVAGAANVALSVAQAEATFLEFQGLLTGNITVTLPVSGENAGLTWRCFNNTTGNFSLTLAAATGGAGVAIPQGSRSLYAFTGVDMVSALSLDASAIGTGLIPTARLGSGVADATTFLRGDQSYVAPATPPVWAGPKVLLPTFPTWVNNGPSSLWTPSPSGYGALLDIATTASPGGHQTQARVKALPATPFTIECLFTPYFSASNTLIQIGLILRRASDDKAIHFAWNWNTGSPQIELQKFDNVGGFNSSYSGVIPWTQLIGRPVWFRITDDGATRKFGISWNFEDYFVPSAWSHAHNDFATMDQVGFMIDHFEGGEGVQHEYLSVLSYRES